MAGNEASPHYPSDLVMITRADDPDDHPFEPYDVDDGAGGEAVGRAVEPFLGAAANGAHGNPETRRIGVGRGGRSTGRRRRRTTRLPPICRGWRLRVGRRRRAQLLSVLTRDPRPEVRLQAVRALASVPWQAPPRATFEKALADADPQVQLAALTAFFTLLGDPPIDPVVKLACSRDDYLRQTATRLLARKATLEQIGKLARSDDAGGSAWLRRSPPASA